MPYNTGMGRPASDLSVATTICVRISALPDRDTASVRAVRRESSRQLAKSSGSEVLDVARALLHTGAIQAKFASRFAGMRWVAYELVQHHPGAMAAMGAQELTEFGLGLDSWGAVDCFSCYLAGPAWQARQVPDSLIHGWTRSPD